jgi:hypothetical protein
MKIIVDEGYAGSRTCFSVPAEFAEHLKELADVQGKTPAELIYLLAAERDRENGEEK